MSTPQGNETGGTASDLSARARAAAQMAAQDERLRRDVAPLPCQDLLALRVRLRGEQALCPGGVDARHRQPRSPSVRRALTETGYTLTPYSMSAGALDNLVRTIQIIGARSVLELGAGVSTLVAARAMTERWGEDWRLTSVDEDAAYAAGIESLLASMAVPPRAAVLPATLRDDTRWDIETRTYDVRRLFPFLAAAAPFDLLVIDGPKAGEPPGHPFARLPTLPLFRPFLRDQAVVVLDDALRDQELIAIAKWIRHGCVRPLGFSPVGHGVFVGRVPAADPAAP